ncbi:MAG: FG-GAP repeat protein, partial [Campylobacterota bacterium]|nr:FG-GAP repeat protein [Campylobacterota bacterium]
NVTQIAKIKSNDTEDYDLFGDSLSIDGNYIAIGAKWEDSTAGGAGSAYLFKINSDANVTQIAKFQADDAQASDNFANSISIDGDYIIVGAEDEGWYGSAYLFKRDSDTSITQIAKIIDVDKKYGDQSDDKFGNSVSISGDYIVIGSYLHDTTEVNAGSAFVFKRETDNTITRLSKIEATNIQYNAQFANSVFIDGDYIVVGAKSEDTTSADSGTVYLFKKDMNQVE